MPDKSGIIGGSKTSGESGRLSMQLERSRIPLQGGLGLEENMGFSLSPNDDLDLELSRYSNHSFLYSGDGEASSGLGGEAIYRFKIPFFFNRKLKIGIGGGYSVNNYVESSKENGDYSKFSTSRCLILSPGVRLWDNASLKIKNKLRDTRSDGRLDGFKTKHTLKMEDELLPVIKKRTILTSEFEYGKKYKQRGELRNVRGMLGLQVYLSESLSVQIGYTRSREKYRGEKSTAQAVQAAISWKPMDGLELFIGATNNTDMYFIEDD